MAISAGWNEGLERTEFVVEFNDQVGRLLCQLSQLQHTLLKGDVPKGGAYSNVEMPEEALITEAKRAGQILERLYGYQLPKVSIRLQD